MDEYNYNYNQDQNQNPYTPDPNYIPQQPGGNVPNQNYIPQQNSVPPQYNIPPQYNVPPQAGMQPQYNMPQQPGMYPPYGQVKGPKPFDPAANHTANILSIISLVCMFIMPGVCMGISSAAGNGDTSNADSTISSIAALLSSGSYIAAWVLIIIARVKCKENKFSKVLLIIYLAILGLGIIGLIVMVIACVSCMKDCKGF